MAEPLGSPAFLAAARAEAPVLHGDPLTYAELRERVAASAAALRAELPPRGFVLLSSTPSSESVIAYLAVLRAGLTAVPIGAEVHRDALEHVLEETRPAARIGDFGEHARALATVPEWSPDDDSRRGQADLSAPGPAPEAPALVLYTSGTTAAPKGVVLSHRNLAVNTASILSAVPLRRDDVVALALPLHHSYGLSVLHTALAVGASLVPVPGFGIPAECVRVLAAAGTTVLPGVPFHFQALLGRDSGFDREAIPDLRCAMVAGGAMPGPLVATFGRRFPDADLHLMYGQTEATARLSSLPPSELSARPGSIGRGIPGVELTVRHADGTAVVPGEVGEIYARGENVMRGYLGDPVASAEALTPWGLRTRDLARVDSDGYVYVVGRRGDFAKVRGHRVSLRAVEERIASCDGIADAIVLGVRDERGGEALVAEVALDAGAAREEVASGLRRRLRAVLPALERPREIRLVDSIPRTPSGKKIRWREKKTASSPDHSRKCA